MDVERGGGVVRKKRIVAVKEQFKPVWRLLDLITSELWDDSIYTYYNAKEAKEAAAYWDNVYRIDEEARADALNGGEE